MKNIFLVTAALIVMVSCKNETALDAVAEVVKETPAKTYPEEITKIFDAHGGISTWDTMNSLSFNLPKGEIEEIHTVDLKSRKARIETKDYVLGFDGEKVWLKQDTTAFDPGRARFYHNLMFYFYAMPFVLGDDGITYSEAPSLVMNDVSYPGTKISFGDGVGDAPDDNYILYRDPKTNEMAWLAYTVTYGKEGPSERYSYIKYDEWQNVNGLKLPSKLQWYKVEDGQPTEMRNAMTFNNVTVTESAIDAKVFAKPAEGTFTD